MNESFYNLTDAISTALANSTIIPSACLDNLALDLRRQRYFDPSPESPMKHGTLERRWMPATNDPDLVRAWFILNDALARRALDCDNSSITVCNNTHYLTIVNASGQAQTFSQNLESIMGWLGVTQETIDTLTAAANDNRRWGYDLAQNNNGLWPQAPIAAASLPPSADTVSDARNEIYAAAISALLCLNRQQDTGKLIEHYVRSCSAAER